MRRVVAHGQVHGYFKGRHAHSSLGVSVVGPNNGDAGRTRSALVEAVNELFGDAINNLQRATAHHNAPQHDKLTESFSSTAPIIS